MADTPISGYRVRGGARPAFGQVREDAANTPSCLPRSHPPLRVARSAGPIPLSHIRDAFWLPPHQFPNRADHEWGATPLSRTHQ
ncbi:hypothetical protein WEI85_46015 [Actinomycetes bacterium KLBMP 9797]